MAPQGPPDLVPDAYCMAIAQQNQRESPLLHLPAELRTRIYELTMDTHRDTTLHDDFHNWDRLNFSRTSRQIFTETAQVYFKTKLLPLSNDNGICCRNPDNWESKFHNLTTVQKQSVTKLVFTMEQMQAIFDKDGYVLLRIWPRLRAIDIRLPSNPPRASVVGTAWKTSQQGATGSLCRWQFVDGPTGAIELS